MPEFVEFARSAPDRPALISHEGTVTFGELDVQANQVARALLSRGLIAGDAVALLATNSTAFVATVLACTRAGFRLTPVNWHLTADEAAYIVDDCEAKALVTSADLMDLATQCRANAPRCVVGLVAGDATKSFESLYGAMAAEPSDPVEVEEPGTTMMYTSGTTGRPKGVHRQRRPNATLLNIYGYNDAGGDVHLLTGPLYHAAPLAFSLNVPLAFGATVVMMERFDALEALALIAEHRVTHTHMVPTMFHRLVTLDDSVRAQYDLSSLRHILHGAAPCPVPVKQRLIAWVGPIVWEYYAATEGTGTFVDSATWLSRPGTVGKPNPSDQVMIGDESGSALAAGEIGLVYIKAPVDARFSYFKDHKKTDDTYRGDYFTLGDVGYMDEDGYLFLTDRSANLIISGGVNIYPAEVDAVLLDHPAVRDAAVIGVHDDEWGESVLGVIELRDGVVPSRELEHELIAHCRERLAHFKCPREIDFVAQLPRADNGKIYKRQLRDTYRGRRDARASEES
jgi:long-chain acyl-CoA synthetase